MIQYAISKGIRMVFSTNATRMTPEIVESIFDSGLDYIIFSLNGTTPDVYASVHGGNEVSSAGTGKRDVGVCAGGKGNGGVGAGRYCLEERRSRSHRLEEL
jgi:hypothetical protein